jgi:hypothetical protein
MSNVTVHQINSDWNGSILNVEEASLHVAVRGVNYENPTLLLQNGIHFLLIQFDCEEMEKGWLEENSHKYTKITKVEEVERTEWQSN